VGHPEGGTTGLRPHGAHVLSDARGNLGKVRIYWTPGLVIKTPGEGQLWQDKVDKGYIERTWSQYKSEVLSNDYLNIIPKNGTKGEGDKLSAKHKKDGFINLLNKPKALHNYCIRNDVGSQYHTELRIED